MSLTDEQITLMAMKHKLHHAERAQRDAIHPFARELIEAAVLAAEQPQPEQPQDHLADGGRGDVHGSAGREPEAFEAGTVAEWREATMADLMGLADEYAYRASLADADPDAGGCGPIASELAEQAARDELEDAMRIALSDRAAPLGLSS